MKYCKRCIFLLIILSNKIIGDAKTSKWACFICSSSSEAECERTQIKQTCLEQQDMCVTRQYEEDKYVSATETRTVKYYEKACGSSEKTCEYYCRAFLDMGHQCKNNCCHTKLCNDVAKSKNEKKRNIVNGATQNVPYETWAFAIFFYLGVKNL